MTYHNDYGFPRRPHAGFQYGFSGGLIMIVVHIILLLIFSGTNNGDLLAFFIAWFVYWMVGRMAAQAHYDSQQDELEPLAGVRAAGMGAAMVTSIIIWVFLIVRGIFRDAIGIFVIADPIGIFCAISLDVFIAMAIGGWAGKTVENKYKIDVGF